MIKLICFDVGDTLTLNSKMNVKIDRNKIVFDEIKHKFPNITREQFEEADNKAKNTYDTELAGDVKRFEPGFKVKQVCEFLDLPIDLEFCANVEDKIFKKFLQNIELPEGVISTLEKLKKQGIILTVTSNGHKRTVLPKLEKTEIKKFFDKIYVSYDFGEDKSTLKIFKTVLNDFKVQPNECLVIGDRIDEDLSAQELDMHTILVKYSPVKVIAGNSYTPEFVITKFPEIITIIKKINGDKNE